MTDGLRALRNLADGREVAFGRDGKPRFDDVDAHFVEQLGDFQLFVMRHRGAWRLFAVTQRGVEDQDVVLLGSCLSWLCLSVELWRLLRRLSPLSGRAPWARSEADKKQKAGKRQHAGGGPDGCLQGRGKAGAADHGAGL